MYEDLVNELAKEVTTWVGNSRTNADLHMQKIYEICKKYEVFK